MSDRPAVAVAYLFTNGMVMAFGPDGQQVPEYQGPGTEVIPRLRADYPTLTIEGVDWATDFGRSIRPLGVATRR